MQLNEFIVNLVFSLVLALFFYLLVEAPFNKLYTTYIGKKEWPFGNIHFGADNSEDAKQGDFECKLVIS